MLGANGLCKEAVRTTSAPFSVKIGKRGWGPTNTCYTTKVLHKRLLSLLRTRTRNKKKNMSDYLQLRSISNTHLCSSAQRWTWIWIKIRRIFSFMLDLDYVNSAWSDLDLVVLFWTFSRSLNLFWTSSQLSALLRSCRLLQFICRFTSLDILTCIGNVHFVCIWSINILSNDARHEPALLCNMSSKFRNRVTFIDSVLFVTHNRYIIVFYICTVQYLWFACVVNRTW